MSYRPVICLSHVPSCDFSLSSAMSRACHAYVMCSSCKSSGSCACHVICHTLVMRLSNAGQVFTMSPSCFLTDPCHRIHLLLQHMLLSRSSCFHVMHPLYASCFAWCGFLLMNIFIMFCFEYFISGSLELLLYHSGSLFSFVF